jgi:hypothetical protein
MAKEIKKIMVALLGRNDESAVIEQAVFFAD